jgi:hypothetical protein
MNVQVSEDKLIQRKNMNSIDTKIMLFVIFGLPIAEFTTTADVNEISNLIEILTATNEWFSLKGSYIIADKGYDSKQNHDIRNTLKDCLK